MIAHLHKTNKIYLDLLTPELEAEIEERFSVKHPRAFYSNAYEEGHWDGMIRMFRSKDKSLSIGFLDELIKLCKEKDLPFDIEDKRKPVVYHPIPKEELHPDILPGITLDPHQMRCCESVYQEGLSSRRGIHKHITGAGKCLGRGTGVILYDGRVKRVEDVRPGDLLMGDDSTPRTVLSTCSGTDRLYKIKQLNGNDYIVNEPHILSLKTSPRKKTERRKVVDISVVDYLNSSNGKKHRLKGYKVPVSFKSKTVPFDPYFLGLWLGDGISKDLQVIVGDDDDLELSKYLQEFCDKSNMILVPYPHYGKGCRSYAIRLYEGVNKPEEFEPHFRNHLRAAFEQLELFNNKHIPDLFKYNSENVRLNILAGFVDSDGEMQVDKDTCIITHRQGKLIDDICYLARSLGFRVTSSTVTKHCSGYASEYTSLTISGNLSRIPTKLSRKKCKDRRINKDPLVYGIDIEYIGVGEYFGFELDGNKRFLLEDFTVTHNTEMMAAIIKMFPGCPTAVIAEEVIVTQQIKERLELREVAGSQGVGEFYAGKRPDGQLVVVGSVQALQTPQPPKRNEGEEDDKWEIRKKAYKTRSKNAKILQKIIGKCHLILIDECDRAASDQYEPLFDGRWGTEARYIYGFSGTPFSKHKPVDNLILRSRFGEVISESERDEVEALGRIIPVSFTMVAVGESGDKYDRMNNNDAINTFMVEGDDLHNTIRKICNLYKDEGKLILVDRVKLGKNLQEKIPNSVFIDGKTSLSKRNKARKSFEKRDLKILIGSKILMRGLDLKGGTENLILCYDGKSDQEFLQRIGRALRNNSKGSARVFDFFFLNNFYLYKHSRERLKNLVEQGYESHVLFPKSGVKISGADLIKRRFRIPKASKKKSK